MVDYVLPLIKVILSSFTSVFIIFNFMDRIFIRRYSENLKYITSFFVGCCMFIISAFVANSIISICITVSITFVTALCLYNARKSSDILNICVFLIFIMLTEIIGQIVVSLINTNPVAISHGDILQSAITFMCYQVAMYFVTKRKLEFDNAGSLITLIVIPALSLFQILILIYLLKDQINSNNKILVLIGCLLVFSMNLIIYVLFHQIATLNYEKSQYQLLEQQRQSQYKYFNELEQNYDESRKFFHDIKNHLDVIEELYKNADSTTHEYSKTVKKEIEQLNITAPSTNRIINILIYKWTSVAKKLNIAFHYQCEDIDLSFMNDKDLATIISNLLDNAFEECLENKLEHNFIDLNVCTINNFIVINLSNSSQSILKYVGEKLCSGKDNHLGLGLTNVQTTVEKYQGLMDISQQNQVFTVQITFFGQG